MPFRPLVVCHCDIAGTLMSANVAICIISGVMEFDGVLARWQGDE